jgi:hypothetical protein
MTRRPLHRTAELCAVALTLVIAQGAVAGPRTKTFATPEAAVEHFVKSVAADDLEGAMEAIAIDDLVARRDFARRARRMGSFIARHFDAPSRYKMYVRTSTLEAMKDAANQTLTFAATFLVDKAELVRLGQPQSESTASAAALGMDLARLQALKIVRIDPPRNSVTSTQKVLDLFSAHAALEGADALTERIALVQLAGQHYVCGFRLLKYGNTWRIQNLMSYFASETGGILRVEKTTPEEFETRTK